MVEVNPAASNKFLARMGGRSISNSRLLASRAGSGHRFRLHEPCRRRGDESLISLGKSETRYLVSYTLRKPKRESHRMQDGRGEDSATAPAPRRNRWAARANASVCGTPLLEKSSQLARTPSLNAAHG